MKGISSERSRDVMLRFVYITPPLTQPTNECIVTIINFNKSVKKEENNKINKKSL